MNWYNENEPYAAAWLGNLIREGIIPDGEVCAQDVRTVGPAELEGFAQCHFFAGIGGWSLALRLAGWPEDREVWTGSCPCQPFSVAGKGRGVRDERHLWPAWLKLIAERKPAVVFGEQVASRLGREWLAGVRADLEALGYAVGAADLCAASAGAPHIRQRLWWVADAEDADRRTDESGQARAPQGGRGRPAGGGGLGDSGGTGGGCDAGAVHRAKAEGDSEGRAARREPHEPVTAGFWSDFDLVACADGKQRRVEPGTFPLAHGVPARVGKLRAYGNAICPQLAATFIRAFMQDR